MKKIKAQTKKKGYIKQGNDARSQILNPWANWDLKDQIRIIKSKIKIQIYWMNIYTIKVLLMMKEILLNKVNLWKPKFQY